MNEVNSRAFDSPLAEVPWPVGLAARLIVTSSAPVCRTHTVTAPPSLPGDETCAVPLASPANLPTEQRRTLADVIAERRSGGIQGGTLAQATFGMLMATATAALPHALLPDPALTPAVFPIVFDVDGLPPAVYRYVPGEHALVPIRRIQRDDVRNEVLLQHEHGNGAAVLFLTVPLARWLHTFGDRGYRGAAFQAGYITDRLYLASETFDLSYTASGGFAPASVDALLGLDGYHYTTMFSFVVGAKPGMVERLPR